MCYSAIEAGTASTRRDSTPPTASRGSFTEDLLSGETGRASALGKIKSLKLGLG